MLTTYIFHICNQVLKKIGNEHFILKNQANSRILMLIIANQQKAFRKKCPVTHDAQKQL